MTSVALVLVCQGGGAEARVAMLASSLRESFFPGNSLQLFALIPGPASVFESPKDVTLDFFKNLGVQIVTIDVAGAAKASRPGDADLTQIKFRCLEIAEITDCDHIVILDSYQFCCGVISPLMLEATFSGQRIGGAEAFSVNDGNWLPVFTECGVSVPNSRFPVESDGKKMLVPPAFSLGFICVAREQAGTLARRWRDCFKTLDLTSLSFGPDKAHLGEASLTAAVASLDQEFLVADSGVIDSSLFRYQHPRSLAPHPHLLRQISDLLQRYPLLNRIVTDDSDWAEVIAVLSDNCTISSQEDPFHQIADVDQDVIHFPLCIAKEFDRIQFVDLTKKTFDSPSFHDINGLGRLKKTAEVSLPRFEKWSAETGNDEKRRVDAIAHTAFCGSTLLARYLHSTGASFYYREPQLMTQLAVQKWLSFQRLEKPAWDAVFSGGMSIMSRQLKKDLVVGMKLHDAGTILGDDFLDWHPDSRLILLYSELDEFLLSSLKQKSRRQWIRTRLPCCAGSTWPVLSDVDIRQLSDAQASAYLWLAQTEMCRRTLESWPLRSIGLRAADLFAEPGPVLTRLCDSLGYDVSEEALGRAIRQHSRTNGKSGQIVEHSQRAEIDKCLRREFAAEIDEGRSWAYEICGDYEWNKPMPRLITSCP